MVALDAGSSDRKRPMTYFTLHRTGSVSTLSLHNPPANFLTTDVLIELSDRLDDLQHPFDMPFGKLAARGIARQ